MTSRRNFLISTAAFLAAPAIVRAESLMRVVAPKPPRLILPSEYSAFLVHVSGVNGLFSAKGGRASGWVVGAGGSRAIGGPALELMANLQREGFQFIDAVRA